LKKKRRRSFEIYIMEENSRGTTWTISNRQEEDSFRTPLALPPVARAGSVFGNCIGLKKGGRRQMF
jgi:hypothetical protein